MTKHNLTSAPARTYWIRATIALQGGKHELTGKVAFGQGRTPDCSLVPEGTPGWNFSNREHAEELAECAAGRLCADLVGATVVTTVIAEA